MKVIRPGYISAAPPDGMKEISLEIAVILDTGKELVKQVTIDVQTGSVIDSADVTDRIESGREITDINIERETSSDLDLGRLRGSLDALEQ